MKKQKIEKLDETFEQIVKEWLLFKKPKIKESSYMIYMVQIRRHLLPKFKDVDITYFLEYDINQYIEELQEKLDKKTVSDIISILKAILRFAEVKYNLNFKLQLVSIPTVRSKKIVVFNDKERRKLERYYKKTNDLRILGVYIALYTGLRIGELCALKWKHIDFTKKILNVNCIIQRIYTISQGTKLITSTPKSENSIRSIPISEALYKELKKIKGDYKQEDYILTGRSDKCIEPRAYQYTYIKILKDCHIPYKNFHCIRHTFASRCIDVGMDPKALSEILGHADVGITLNRYVHSSYKIKKRYVDKL